MIRIRRLYCQVYTKCYCFVSLYILKSLDYSGYLIKIFSRRLFFSTKSILAKILQAARQSDYRILNRVILVLRHEISVNYLLEDSNRIKVKLDTGVQLNVMPVQVCNAVTTNESKVLQPAEGKFTGYGGGE